MSIGETMGHAGLFLKMRDRVEWSYLNAVEGGDRDAAVFLLDLGDLDARAIAELALEPALVDDLVDRDTGAGDSRLCTWGVPRGLAVEALRAEYPEVALQIAAPPVETHFWAAVVSHGHASSLLVPVPGTSRSPDVILIEAD